MCLNGMCLKIRTSTCFLHGSRAPNSSAFERNYCRTALLTCLYFTFLCRSYTKHTFMVDRTGFKPTINLPCKGSGFDHSHHRPIKISFTHQSCLQASILTTSLYIFCLLITTILQSMLCLGIEPSADDGILPSFTLSLH